MWSNASAEDHWLQNKLSLRKQAAAKLQCKTSSEDSSPMKKNLTFYTAAMVAIIIVAPVITAKANNYQDEVLSSSSYKQAQFVEPEGDENVHTVAVGRPIKFKCVVNNLGDRKVAWFHKDKRILLALDNKTITRNDRIHASSQANSVFFLQIDSVQLADKGHYSCQLNTQPIQSLLHTLHVIQPPQIREELTTVSVEPVKEFGSVELKCVADGIPKPTIKWRRESQMHVIPALDYEDDDDAAADQEGNSIESGLGGRPQMAPGAAANNLVELESSGRGNGKTERPNDAASPSSSSQTEGAADETATRLANELTTTQRTMIGDDVTPMTTTIPSPVLMVTTTTTPLSAQSNSNANKSFIAEGEVLRIDRISRYDMGFYMCIASNGVPPSVSQRIFLPVSFVPKASTRAPSRSPVGARNQLKGSSLDAASVASFSVVDNGDSLSRSTRPTVATVNSQGQPGRSTMARHQHRKHQRTAASSATTSAATPRTTTTTLLLALPTIASGLTTTKFMATIIWIYSFNIIYCYCYCSYYYRYYQSLNTYQLLP